MFEQTSNQVLALSKQAAETFVKANAIAVDGFEKLFDIQLKSLETGLKSATDFVSQTSEIRDFDSARTAWPKSATLLKDSAEKFYATSQEVTGVVVKTTEAFSNLLKGTVEAANDAVVKAPKAAAKR